MKGDKIQKYIDYNLNLYYKLIQGYDQHTYNLIIEEEQIKRASLVKKITDSSPAIAYINDMHRKWEIKDIVSILYDNIETISNSEIFAIARTTHFLYKEKIYIDFLIEEFDEFYKKHLIKYKSKIKKRKILTEKTNHNQIKFVVQSLNITIQKGIPVPLISYVKI